MRRIGALLVVLAIVLTGVEWCLAHQHAEVAAASVADCPAPETHHEAEQSARQPGVASGVACQAPEVPAVIIDAPTERDHADSLGHKHFRSQSGAARLIGLCISRT